MEKKSSSLESYQVTKLESKPSKLIDAYLIFNHATWIFGECFNFYNVLLLLNTLNVRKEDIPVCT